MTRNSIGSFAAFGGDAGLETGAPNITRRQFVRLCGGTAAVVLPFGLTRCAPPRSAHELIEDVEWKKGLADAILRVTTSRGATFADVRVVRNLIQTIAADDQAIKGVPGEWHYGSSPEHVLEKVDIGFNVRVLKNGAWGFAASPVLSEDEAAAVAGLACDLAEKAALTVPEPIRLVPEPVHVDTWVTPHDEDPFTVPLHEKVALLLRINEEVRKNPRTDRAFSWLDFWDENKFYANSEGAEIQQRLVRSDGSFFARARVDGVTAQRRFFVNPLNIGYEYIRGLDLPSHAERIAAEAVEKAKAPLIDFSGQMDVVMDPQNICLFEHETIGHPTELNRTVLVETNFAGSTFLAPEDMGSYEFGSPVTNFVGDRSRPMLRSTCGYDDEGVKTQEWDVVREGKLVGFQTTREFATYVGEEASRGCCMTESWDRVPQGRMPNLSLEPGGQDAPSPEELIADTRRGLLFRGFSSRIVQDYQRRYHTYTGNAVWEIENGRTTRMLRGAHYYGKNPSELWHRLETVTNPASWEPAALDSDDIGQPTQRNHNTHGAPWARFRNLNVGGPAS